MRGLIYITTNGHDRCFACNEEFLKFIRSALLVSEQLNPTLTQNGNGTDLAALINSLDETDLLAKYIDHLCPSILAAPQRSMREQLRDTIRFSKTTFATKLAMHCEDENVTIMISDENSDSEGSLHRDIQFFHRIVNMLHGPCDYLLETSLKSVKQYLQRELARIFETYISLKSADQMFWFDAIESIHLGDDARRRVMESLKKVRALIFEKAKSARLLNSSTSGASLNPNDAALSHIALLVDTKISSLIAQPGAHDLAKGDLVLLALLAKSEFSSQPAANDNLVKVRNKGASRQQAEAREKNAAQASSRSTWYGTQALRAAFTDTEYAPHSRSQPQSGRNSNLITDDSESENTNPQSASTIPRYGADSEKHLEAKNSKIASWNVNGKEAARSEASTSSVTNDAEENDAIEANEDVDVNNSLLHSEAVRQKTQQNTQKNTGATLLKAFKAVEIRTRAVSESELDYDEKIRKLRSFVYRRIVHLATAECAYMPYEVYFVRVDSNTTLILLFRLANAQLASSVYLCNRILEKLRLAHEEFEAQLDNDTSYTNASSSLFDSNVVTNESTSQSSAVKITGNSATDRDRTSRTNEGSIIELGPDERTALIRDFERALKPIIAFSKRLKPKEMRKQYDEPDEAFRFNSSIVNKCGKVESLWDEVKFAFYQRFYASRQLSDRQKFGTDIAQLIECIKYSFQLGFASDWWRSSDKSLALRARRADSFLPLFDTIRSAMRVNLQLPLEFLLVRSQSNICITKYITEYPGLIYFALVNRSTSQRISTSINIDLNDLEDANDERNYIRCLAQNKDNIMKAVDWYRDMLGGGTQAQFGIMTRHGFKFSFYRYVEDANNGAPLESGSPLYDPIMRLTPENARLALEHGLQIKELFMVHLSTVQSGKVVDHMRRLLLYINRYAELQI